MAAIESATRAGGGWAIYKDQVPNVTLTWLDGDDRVALGIVKQSAVLTIGLTPDDMLRLADALGLLAARMKVEQG